MSIPWWGWVGRETWVTVRLRRVARVSMGVRMLMRTRVMRVVETLPNRVRRDGMSMASFDGSTYTPVDGMGRARLMQGWSAILRTKLMHFGVPFKVRLYREPPSTGRLFTHKRSFAGI